MHLKQEEKITTFYIRPITGISVGLTLFRFREYGPMDLYLRTILRTNREMHLFIQYSNFIRDTLRIVTYETL